MRKITFFALCIFGFSSAISLGLESEACSELLNKARDYENADNPEKNEEKLFSNYYEAAIACKHAENEALKYLQAKAEAGISCAEYFLGRYYGDDRLSSCDEEKAFHWYSKAAEKNYPPALYKAARAYIDASGTKKDTELGGELLLKSAELGYRDAQTIAARYYTNFLEYYTRVYNRNYSKALYWFGEAAKLGSLESKFDMGVCYFHGLGARDDKSKAFEIWNSMLEELDENKKDFSPLLKTKVVVALSRCYYNGWGCKADEKKSMELLKQIEKGAENDSENKKYLEMVKGDRRYELVNFSFKPNL